MLAAAVAAFGVGAAQPWSIHLGTSTVSSDTGVADHNDVAGDLGAAVGRDVERSQVGKDNQGAGSQRGTGNVQGGTGNQGAGSQRGTGNVQGGADNQGAGSQRGTGNVQGSGNLQGSRNQNGGTDQQGRINQQGSNNQQDNGAKTTNNYPAPKPNPPTGGSATMVSAVPADGGTTMGSNAKITYQVKTLPNNGNQLFLVCNLLGRNGSPNLYFAKAELTELGVHSSILQFGGAASGDPVMIGSVRLCGVVTATSTAANILRGLMQADEQGQDTDRQGYPYDMQRTSLPDGVVSVSPDWLSITIER